MKRGCSNRMGCCPSPCSGDKGAARASTRCPQQAAQSCPTAPSLGWRRSVGAPGRSFLQPWGQRALHPLGYFAPSCLLLDAPAPASTRSPGLTCSAAGDPGLGHLLCVCVCGGGVFLFVGITNSTSVSLRAGWPVEQTGRPRLLPASFLQGSPFHTQRPAASRAPPAVPRIPLACSTGTRDITATLATCHGFACQTRNLFAQPKAARLLEKYQTLGHDRTFKTEGFGGDLMP